MSESYFPFEHHRLKICLDWGKVGDQKWVKPCESSKFPFNVFPHHLRVKHANFHTWSYQNKAQERNKRKNDMTYKKGNKEIKYYVKISKGHANRKSQMRRKMQNARNECRVQSQGQIQLRYGNSMPKRCKKVQQL